MPKTWSVCISPNWLDESEWEGITFLVDADSEAEAVAKACALCAVAEPGEITTPETLQWWEAEVI